MTMSIYTTTENLQKKFSSYLPIVIFCLANKYFSRSEIMALCGLD